MSEVAPPNQYFPTIIYNPQFWTVTSASSGQYLARIGTPTSIATTTTFTGAIIANDLTVTNVINGTANQANNVYTTNNNANATHYLTYVDTPTNGYGGLQKHSTLTFNPNQETLTADNIVGAVSMTTVTQSTADNSTKVATTAFVKNQGYTTLAVIQSNNNTWSGTNTFNTSLPTSSITTLTSTNQFVPVVISDVRYGKIASANGWSSTNTFNSFLPTSTISTLSATTQIAPVAILDGRYGRLNGVANTWALTQTFSLPPIMSGANISTSSINCSWNSGYTAIVSAIAGLLLTPSRANYALGSDTQTHLSPDPLLNNGVGNTSMGDRSLQNNVYGSNNVALASQSLSALTSGNDNCAFGTSALQSCNGSFNVGIGSLSAPAMTTSSSVVSIGYYSFENLISGDGVAIGDHAGGGIITGIWNTFVGTSAGALSDKSASTAIGNNAKINGDSATAIGYNSSAGYNNSTAIGYSATTGAVNEIALGTSAETVKVYGNLNIVGNTTFTGTLNTVSSTIFGYISTLSSNAQTQITNIVNGTTAITVNGQSIRKCSPTLVTGTTLNLTTGTIYDVYSISITATLTITLPTITASNVGQRFSFRRVAGTTTITAVSSATNIYPTTSFTAQTTILASAGYSTTIFSALLSATPTYGWFIE